MRTRSRNRARGFTLMESLVLIGILIVLLSIFIPYIGSIRETNRRVRCASNLYQLRDALANYARDNGRDYPRVRYDAANNPDGYTAFTGADAPNPFTEDSAVQPNDVTASLWLLVQVGYVIDTRIFICPSSSDTRDLLTDAHGQAVKAAQRGNFRKPENLSYSYASPFSAAPGFRMNDTKRAECALMADKNPGEAAARYGADLPPDQLALANSPNHSGVGQNVLFADNTVRFIMTPYCGVGYKPRSGGRAEVPGDNIYTARMAQSATQPTTLPMAIEGIVGFGMAAVSNDDSYLVPTATNPGPAPIHRPTTRPQPTTETQPATTTRATTMP